MATPIPITAIENGIKTDRLEEKTPGHGITSSLQSSATSGSVRARTITHTIKVASSSNQVESFRVNLVSNVKTGAWANAGMFCINYDATGYAHGIAGVVCAELDMPSTGASCIRGSYCTFQSEINIPSALGGQHPFAHLVLNQWGSAASHMDSYGGMFVLDGYTAATGKMVFTNSIRIFMDGFTASNYKYLPYSDAEQGLHLGLTGSKATLTASKPFISAYTTSAATTGALNTVTISQTMTAESTGNQVEVAQFILTADVKTGAWANAILAKIDYSTNGLAHGIAGVVCAEIDLPGSSVVRGTYTVFEAEINCPTNCAMNANPIHVFQINSWGTNKTQFDTVGYLFELSGVTSGAGNIWYDAQKAAPAVEEFVRVKTPSGTRYLALYDANA